jgi:Ca2+-binding RTX toxin-like protein
MHPGLRRIARVAVACLAGSAVIAPGAVAEAARRVACHGEGATLIGTRNSDELRGTAGADVIVGRAGFDKIVGGGGADLICSGGGADLIRAGAGADVVDGGRDFDRIGYERAKHGVKVNLPRGKATGQGHDRLLGIEGVQGSHFGDIVSGDGAAELIKGIAGNDKIFTGRGADFVVGGAGNDHLSDRFGSNTLLAYGGNDVIVARPSDGDWLDGGPGRDKIRFTRRDGVTVDLGTGEVESPVGARVWAFEVVVGTPGGDRIHGSRRGERIVGRGASDALFGRGRADALWGAAGMDLIRGGGGRDLARGGPGVDICSVERDRGCEL